MLIVIVLCLIHHYNLEPVIYMILELHHIFVVFLAVRLVLVSDSLEQKLLDGETVYLLHCLMFLDCLVFVCTFT